MATATVATATGAVILLYYMMNRRVTGDDCGSSSSKGGDSTNGRRNRRKRVARRPVQAPANWFEAMVTLSETLRFTYSETLGKWPIGDLAFGINFLLKRQGNVHVASEYAGSDSVALGGFEFREELKFLVKLLTICYNFSKKPFHVFLEITEYSLDDVLLQEPKAGILKPAFTILSDKDSKFFLLVIRGTHSMKDTLTAATGAVVPFHHSVLDDVGVSNLVLGYAHCGMVAAARWIAKIVTPCLLKAVGDFPDYKIKIVGHSLGGGTAALLTYILREHKEFSSTTCVTFGSAACMTWDLAESGKSFITSVVNNTDLVPTFSAASVDGLRSEVTASSWLNDLRDQIEHTRFLSTVYRSASALGSRLPSISAARARVAGAGALLRPVSSSTQVVMRRAQTVAQAVVRTRSSLASWSCMGARRRTVVNQIELDADTGSPRTMSPVLVESMESENEFTEDSPTDTGHEETEDDDEEDGDEEEGLIRRDHNCSPRRAEEMTEDELWHELEKEMQRQGEIGRQVQEEEAAAMKEITEESNGVLTVAGENNPSKLQESAETLWFYPPGRLVHIVTHRDPESSSGDEGAVVSREKVGIYETPRSLYSKLRLSKTMINDHYMPCYKRNIEIFIDQLDNEFESGVDNESDNSVDC